MRVQPFPQAVHFSGFGRKKSLAHWQPVPVVPERAYVPTEAEEEADRLFIQSILDRPWSQQAQDAIDRNTAMTEAAKREYQAKYADKSPVDNREAYRRTLIADPWKNFVRLPSGGGPLSMLTPAYAYSRLDHPDKEKAKKEYGKIEPHEVEKALRVLVTAKQKDVGRFSIRPLRIHETEICRAISPKHWQQPIIEEQMLNALSKIRDEGRTSGNKNRLKFEAKQAKDGKLWIYPR